MLSEAKTVVQSVVQSVAEAASLIGSTIADRYRLLEVIGEGGIGRVYRAEEIATSKAVAVKLLHPELVGNDQIVQRFEREAKVTTELSHPNIVNVIEFGEWNGRLFLVMELLAGKSLAELIGDGGKNGRRQTVKRTLAIMRPVFDALDYAHGRGVVHRDLKPENIMVNPGGLLTRECIRLLDFGIAKLAHQADRPATEKLTAHGLVLGTPAYMSPEQASGLDADVRSDTYSCGVILYQMLTGHRPFEGETPFDVLRMHLTAQPRPLREVADGAWIPAAVESVVLRAMAKRPAERYQSAGQLRQALEQAAVIDYAHDGASAPAPRSRLSPGSRFLCLAIILGCGVTLLAAHVRERRAAARNSAAAASAVVPPASPDPEVAVAPEVTQEESSDRGKRTAKARHSKRPGARKYER